MPSFMLSITSISTSMCISSSSLPPTSTINKLFNSPWFPNYCNTTHSFELLHLV
jgi:hypothetical protein